MAAGVVLALFTVPAVSCGRAAPAAVPVERRLGWIDDGCLIIANATLTRGSRISIFTFDDAGGSRVEGQIADRVDSDGACEPLRPERRAVNTSEGRVAYRVQLPSGQPIALGIGVLDATLGRPLDVDGDGATDQPSQCATSEGIAFGLWSGAPYASRRLWSGYDYLGIDVEPTCPS